MEPADALARHGGVAPAGLLLALTSRKTLRVALERGEVARVARGRYRLPGAPEAMVKAERLSGALALRSAALEHRRPVTWTPDEPDIAVARNRHRPSARGVNLVRMAGPEPGRRVTSPLDTVLMAARRLPFDEALAIADSALRSRLLPACGWRVFSSPGST